jgi:hypothetical protein
VGAARLRETVLLHLEESSPAYLEKLRRFLAERRDRRLIVQRGRGAPAAAHGAPQAWAPSKG